MDIGLVNRRDLDIFEGFEQFVVFERAIRDFFGGKRLISIIN